jgi:hypothetical protein
MMEENARIAKTFLGSEHGILTLWLYLEGDDGWVQGFGGIALDGPPTVKPSLRTPQATAGAWIAGLLRTLEVTAWEQLPGIYVRVRRQGPGHCIASVGHILKDQWYPEVNPNRGSVS